MTEKTLLLPRHLVQDLFHQAQLAPEREVCGLISQASDGSLRCYPVANVAGDPTHSFDMDAQGQINALREIRERSESLFAIYHSHPDAPPEPSERDRTEVSFPQAYYLIISLNTKGVLEMRAWQNRDDQFSELPLKIIRE